MQNRNPPPLTTGTLAGRKKVKLHNCRAVWCVQAKPDLEKLHSRLDGSRVVILRGRFASRQTVLELWALSSTSKNKKHLASITQHYTHEYEKTSTHFVFSAGVWGVGGCIILFGASECRIVVLGYFYYFPFSVISVWVKLKRYAFLYLR